MDSETNEGTSQHQTPKSSAHPHWMVKLAGLLLIIIISYGIGLKNGQQGYAFVPKQFKLVNQADQPKTVNYQLLWDAINVLNTKYIDQPIDQQKVLYGAIAGAVGAVGDPYTVFFTPTNLNNFQTDLKGSFDGIGAEVGMKDANVVIIAPLDDSPAKKAGILAGDIIAKVDGQSTAGWTVDQAVDKIRGPEGTSVTLTLVRQGKSQPIEVTIKRQQIVIKSVKWQVQNVPISGGVTKKIAVISISQFGDDTVGLFTQAVNDVLAQNVSGVVLDLRNNPGGYLESAVSVASEWLKSGELVVTEAKSNAPSQAYNASGSPRLNGIKTVVLINGGSASAAEILSGALHDHGYGELIGEKSFGKGSVQEIVNLSDGSGVKVTVAKWITPGGVNLNHNGLTPDVPVTLTQDEVNAGKDPQMDKAMQEVTK